jgi:urocanate hydratase
MLTNSNIAEAMKIKLDNVLPEYPEFEKNIRRAPDRGFNLNPQETEIALKNALRYIPAELHDALIPEFLEELQTRGRIYGYRFRPAGRLYGKPIDSYKATALKAKHSR